MDAIEDYFTKPMTIEILQNVAARCVQRRKTA